MRGLDVLGKIYYQFPVGQPRPLNTTLIPASALHGFHQSLLLCP